jgi:hypothetical protein
MKILTVTIAIIAASVLGCATSFTGSAHIEGGRNGCEAKCRGQGMQIAGMVYMGEYSSACVCEVPRSSGSGERREILASAAGASGAAAGVVMQMERQRQQQQMTMH